MSSKNTICVIRQFEGRAVHTPVEKVTDLKAGEAIVIGNFTETETWRGGPSGSHVVEVCHPVGTVENSVLPKFGHKNGKLIDGEGGLRHVISALSGQAVCGA
jgi:hypothetical protein